MCTQLQLNRIVSAMVDCYRTVYGKDIVEIVLYGSYARGDYTENSDMELKLLDSSQISRLPPSCIRVVKSPSPFLPFAERGV